MSPDAAMEPFVAALETYHSLTEPSTWLEGVVKAYVGDGLAADFYREVAAFVDPETKGLIDGVLADKGHAEFAVREVRAEMEAQSVAGRPARAVGATAGRRGDQPDAARARRPRRADDAARRGDRRPVRRGQPDQPDHRAARGADDGAGPVLLSAATATTPKARWSASCGRTGSSRTAAKRREPMAWAAPRSSAAIAAPPSAPWRGWRASAAVQPSDSAPWTSAAAEQPRPGFAR